MSGRAHRVLLSVALSLLGLSICSCERRTPSPVLAVASVAAAPVQTDRLSVLRAADAAGFALADTPRHFEFPQDHGPHPRFRHEWWYFTGQLQRAGETFGFELTIFRLALRPPPVASPTGTAPAASIAGASAWRARQVYAAHFAITDVGRRRFFNATRYARDALDLAGAQAQPFALHVADWSVVEAPGDPQSAHDPLHWQLQATDGDYQLRLDLRAAQPPVLNGAAGLSRKADAPGAASYYYSMPRLQAAGSLRREGISLPVSGVVWLDREWGSGSLGVDQQGWDWFALDLDDGSTLMFYALRDRDGRRDVHSAGTFVDAAGYVTPLSNDDVEITVQRHWSSPLGGQYPAQWALRVRSQELQLTVRPLLAAQELSTLPRYWEGAVQVAGLRHGKPVRAQGYVELVGYAQNQASPSVPSATAPPTH
jgi:predicted secreted hydrolase